METTGNTAITVQAAIKAPLEKVWKYWSEPEHITRWCNASDDWHVPTAENDLRVDGEFKTVMAAKDGSAAFDFKGTYLNVEEHKLIEYIIADGRKVKITFSGEGNETQVTETFDAEKIHSEEMQKAGWQSILDNFKRYTEEN